MWNRIWKSPRRIVNEKPDKPMTQRNIFSELIEGFDALKSDGDVAGLLARSARRPPSEARVPALVKARLRAKDAVTIRHPSKAEKKSRDLISCIK